MRRVSVAPASMATVVGTPARTWTSTPVRSRTHTLRSEPPPALLLHIEPPGGPAPIGEAVDELLVSLGQGNQGRTDFAAEAQTRRLHRVKAPVLVNGVRAGGIGAPGQGKQ